MIFQKKPGCQESRHLFTRGKTALEHTFNYDYLELKISASGNFDLAVNALREKARRAFYAIKRKFYKIDIPIKIFDSVILPFAVVKYEVKNGVHSVTKTTRDGTSIQQRPCMLRM